MCTAQLFSQGSTTLYSNCTWTGSSPISHSWHQKIRDIGLPTVKTASLCVPSFWHNTGVWQTDTTDRQTFGYAVAYTALAKPALWHAIKKWIWNQKWSCQGFQNLKVKTQIGQRDAKTDATECITTSDLWVIIVTTYQQLVILWPFLVVFYQTTKISHTKCFNS